MGKVVIINEDVANELKDMLTMTQFKFKANIKKFLAALLEDPTGAEPDMIFIQNGLDKNKLIKSLVDNKVITKKMTIDDHDENGNPHTARMIVKYSVPKERFNERLDALYDVLFPNVDARINEDGGGACAAACGGAPGDGGATSSNNSGQYGPVPLFGGITVRKKKKDNDNLTEAVTGDDGRKSSAVYAYAKNNKDEWCILAAKRNKNWDDEGGKMNPPMGHRHKYESPEDGAVRECEEESGIKFDKKDLVLASKEDWGTNFKIYLPGKTSDYKPGEGDEENTKFKWIPVSEIDNYDWAWSCGTFAKRFKPKKSLNELNTKTYQNAASVAYERGKYDEPDDRVKKFRNAAIQAHRNNNNNFVSSATFEDEKLQDNFVNDNSNEKLVIFDPDYTNLKSLYDGVKQGRLLIHCRKVDENNIPRVIEPEFGETVQDAYGCEFGDDIEKPELIFASDDFSWSKAYPRAHSSYSDQRNGVFFVYSNNFDKYLGDGYIQSVDGQIYMSDDTPIIVESGDWFTDRCVDVAAVLIVK